MEKVTLRNETYRTEITLLLPENMKPGQVHLISRREYADAIGALKSTGGVRSTESGEIQDYRFGQGNCGRSWFVQRVAL